MEVTLPNGQVVTDIPEDVTQKQLVDILLKNNVIGQEEARSWMSPEEEAEEEAAAAEAPVAAAAAGQGGGRSAAARRRGPQGQDALSSAGDFLSENMDLPGGLAGAALGAKVGAVGGPLGAAAGAVVGGAVGTFGGSLLSDWLSDEKMDMDAATQDALISAGFDVATLGTFKVAKPVLRSMGFGTKEIAEMLAREAGEDVASAGSKKSLQQTQQMLQEGDSKASLTAFQAGQDGTMANWAEALAQAGMLSNPAYAARESANARVIAQNIDDLMTKSLDQNIAAGHSVGESVLGVVEGGKKAAQAAYDKGLTEVAEKLGSASVNPKSVSFPLKKFLKDNAVSYGSTLDKQSQKLVNDWINTLDNMNGNMPVDDLLKFQKQVNTQITALGEFGQAQNTVASRELAQLASEVRSHTSKLLKRTNPNAAAQYEQLNKAYGTAMEGIVPKLNQSTIASAKQGDYDAIARALDGSNPDKIGGFMDSIDNSYKVMTGDQLKDLPYKTADEAKAAVRQGWLKNIFGDATNMETFQPSNYAYLAEKYDKPANRKIAEKIMGQDYPQFKKIVNAMRDVSQKQSGLSGELVLRSRELGALQGIAGGGLALAGPAGMLGAGAVFGLPVIIGKVISNPKAVNRLVTGIRKSGGPGPAAQTAIPDAIEAVWEMMSEEDQTDVRNQMRGIH